jgi:hypothetical protein
MFNSPSDTQARMREMDGYLERRIGVEREALNDTTLPRSERDNAARAIRDLENFRNILGVPQETRGRDDVPPPPASLPEEYRNLWPFMTPEERALWPE